MGSLSKGSPRNTKILSGLGPELASNGGFDTATVWSGTNWTISGGTANATASSSSLFAPIAATQGLVYRVTFDLVAFTSGTLTCSVGQGTASANQTIGGVGAKSVDVTCGAEATPNMRFSGAALTASIDNVSVRQL